MSSMQSPNGTQPPLFDLTMNQGPRAGENFPLTNPVTTIGRASDNDIVIEDQDVSRSHARITSDGQQLVIEDLGSANGTFVNGVRLTAPQVLGNGDSVRLADRVIFAVRAPGAISAATPEGAEAPAEPVLSPAEAGLPPSQVPPPRAARRGWMVVSALGAVGVFIALAVAAAAGYYCFRQWSDVTRPAVAINSPEVGAQVEVGRPITVDTVTHDKKKIIRAELWVDGQLLNVKNSSLPDGTSPFSMSTDWRPSTAGNHTLVVRAFNRKGDRGQAEISVEAVESADRDDDDIPDEEDACPDEPGSEAARGCPDRDLDGVSDAEDLCPDEPGTPETDGCPAPRSDDRDGDGVPNDVDACPDELGSHWTEGCPDRDEDEVLDAEDACPDVWGVPEYSGCLPPDDRDGDSLSDDEDACPDEWGLPDADGCPDEDGDTVNDLADACPDEWGLVDLDGCPDVDMDGIRDGDDACPTEAGPVETHGCPDSGAGDRDEDGVPDDHDMDADEAGDPADGGAPGPGEGEDADDDGTPDDEELPGDPFGDVDLPDGFLGDVIVYVPLEFQALELEVDDDYDEVHAYAGLAGQDMEEFGPFAPLGDRQWDIAEVLGGGNSIHLAAPLHEPLEVRAAVGAHHIEYGEGSAWGSYYDLGEFIREHPVSDWDEHVITVRSEGSPDGRWFQTKYRLCRDACESSTIPPPVATLIDFPEGKRVWWMWGGNERTIDGFRIYRDGSVAIAPIGAHTRSHSVRFFDPPCGRTLSFYVTAFRGDEESPPSNTVYWNGPRCPRTVQVTFESLDVGNLRGWVDGSMSRVRGNFWVLGSDGKHKLEFRSHDRRLADNTVYSIQGIFNQIIRRRDSCTRWWCPTRYAPETDSISVELGPYDDLTFGGKIRDWIGTLFEAERTLEASDVVPGQREIRNRDITLRVRIDVLAGP